MAREKKSSVYLSMRIEKDASEKINEICRDVGLTKTKVVEKAIDRFFEEYKKTGKV